MIFVKIVVKALLKKIEFKQFGGLVVVFRGLQSEDGRFLVRVPFLPLIPRTSMQSPAVNSTE